MATKKLTPATRKASPVTKKGSTADIIATQSADDPKIWSTEAPGIPVSHFRAKKTAGDWVRNFNLRKAALPKNAFMQPENLDKQIFLDLLSRPEVKMLRVYFGLNEFNKVRLIFVGADAKHNDVYVKQKRGKGKPVAKTSQAAATTQGDGDEGAIDFGQSCPAYGSGLIETLP